MTKMFFLLVPMFSLFFGFSEILSAQIIPGQSRAEVEEHSGEILWEEEALPIPGQVHQVLYSGRPEKVGEVPFLALFVNDILLLPVFFVSAEGFSDVMSQLQENPNVTQRLDDEYTLSFVSVDGQYAYKLSSALVKGMELTKGLAGRDLLMKYLSPSSAYAIMHIDYYVVNALGFDPLQ